MPTGREQVENRALTGAELKQILINDFTRMLERDAMFANRLSYERASYRIKVQLFLPLPQYPEHTAATQSIDPPKNEKDGKKKLLTAPPKSQLATVGLERSRVIDSPNLARLTNDLPITINRRNPESGRIEEIPVKYEVEDAGANYPDLNQAKDREISAEPW